MQNRQHPLERRTGRARAREAVRGAESVETEIDLLRCIAAHVRREREARQQSRAELARRAGLSVRFLAQLEAGDANISILRLQEIAQALDVELVDLLRAYDEQRTEGLVDTARTRARVDALLRERTDGELAEVRDWLAARFSHSTGPLVALLGLRGAGKSSVGRALARQLGVAFFELDALIEAAAGLRLEQIFELQGRTYYRQLEHETLVRFLATTSAGVLATGGGIVTEPATFALLRHRCHTVWLRAQPEEHWERVVRQGDQRPMQDNPAAMQELRSLLGARQPLYAKAHVTLDTSKRRVADVARELAQRLREPR